MITNSTLSACLAFLRKLKSCPLFGLDHLCVLFHAHVRSTITVAELGELLGINCRQRVRFLVRDLVRSGELIHLARRASDNSKIYTLSPKGEDLVASFLNETNAR